MYATPHAQVKSALWAHHINEAGMCTRVLQQTDPDDTLEPLTFIPTNLRKL